MSSSPPVFPPYQPHRNSQSFDPKAPPAPPPKPSSQEVSRRGTPAGTQPLPPPQQDTFGSYGRGLGNPQSIQQARFDSEVTTAGQIPDPDERWLPVILEDKTLVTFHL
jgi:hypothetical protein